MILDSDILIELLRHNPIALAWFALLPETPKVSGIAVLEVTFGARDRAELKRIETVLADFTVVWPEAIDTKHAASYAALRLSNGIGILDAMAAAIAVRTREPLATFNVKHFKAIPKLSVLQPYVR